AEDEIDLADLAAVLYRNRYLIIAGTLLVALAAAGYSWLQPKKFQTTTFIEIGQNLVDGTYQNVESPAAIKNRYEAAASSLTRTFEGNGPEGDLLFSPKEDLTVETPEEGNLLQAEITAPKSAASVRFMEALNRDLVQAHDRIFSQEKANLKNQIERQKLAIQKVDNQISEKKRNFKVKKLNIGNKISRIKEEINKTLNNKVAETQRKYEIKRIQRQNKISSIEGRITDLKNNRSNLKETIALLSEEQKDLEKRIQDAEELHQDLIKSKSEANQLANQDSAIGLMLFNSELMQIRRHLNTLRERALFEIPQRIADLRNQVKEVGTKIQNQKAELQKARTQLSQLEEQEKDELEAIQTQIRDKKAQLDKAKTKRKQLDADLKSAIEGLKAQKTEKRLQIQALNNQLDNRIVTHVTGEAQLSQEPVSNKFKLHIALGLVLGGFLSVFLAFIREFWRNNRKRIVREAEEGG
ncbi:MAG: Wzz/FepE/Etk N-terminal domain-containing protein, partial [Thiohalorhabdaceae bacterium]